MKYRGLYNVDVSQRYADSVGHSRFAVGAKAHEKSVDLLIHGVVGDPYAELDSLSVAGFLSQHEDKPVNVRVNSEGGFVFDGIAIANALAQHEAPTTATVEGLAASAASVLLTGADTIRMAETATLMVHRSWVVTMGNRAEHAESMEILDLIDRQLTKAFVARTGLSENRVQELLEGSGDGTWLDAEQSLELGFIDEIVPAKAGSDSAEPVKAAAKLNQADLAEAVAVRRRLAEVTA
jgi:ATP-dependent protease ClpP protease subunit